MGIAEHPFVVACTDDICPTWMAADEFEGFRNETGEVCTEITHECWRTGHIGCNSGVAARHRPGLLIRRLHQFHVALFTDGAAHLAITPVQFSLLSAISSRELVDQSTLAADVALDRSTLR
jgi:hypothetical protein